MYMLVGFAVVVYVFVFTNMIIVSWIVAAKSMIVLFTSLHDFLLVCVGLALLSKEKHLPLLVLLNPVVFLLEEVEHDQGIIK